MKINRGCSLVTMQNMQMHLIRSSVGGTKHGALPGEFVQIMMPETTTIKNFTVLCSI